MYVNIHREAIVFLTFYSFSTAYNFYFNVLQQDNNLYIYIYIYTNTQYIYIIYIYITNIFLFSIEMFLVIFYLNGKKIADLWFRIK